VLPRDERQTISDQVDNAGLHDGLREHRGDRLWEPLETIDHRDENVVDAASPELVDHFEPELGSFGVLDPKS
jgi:hypothetical protein